MEAAEEKRVCRGLEEAQIDLDTIISIVPYKALMNLRFIGRLPLSKDSSLL